MLSHSGRSQLTTHMAMAGGHPPPQAFIEIGPISGEGSKMLARIIEIAGEGRRLSLDRGFLTITGPDGLLGQVHLTMSKPLLLRTRPLPTQTKL